MLDRRSQPDDGHEHASRPAVLATLLLAVGGASHAQETPVVVSGAAGSAFAPPAETVRMPYDYRGLADVEGSLADFLAINADLPGSVAAADLTFEAARRNLRDLFSRPQDRAFLEAVGSSPQHRSLAGLNAAAVGFFLQGRQAETLACLLLAADMAPGDFSVLANLAASALGMRRANEAVALLAEAGKLAPPPGGVWGLSGENLLAYLHGYALMLRGDYAAAKSLLQGVVESEPHLKEAALTLALVQARLGDEPRRAFLQGVWRHRGKLIVRKEPPERSPEETVTSDDRDPYADGDSVAPSMADLYDLSRGTPGLLPRVERPGTTLDLMGMAGPYGEAMVEAMNYAAALRNDIAAPAVAAFRQSAGQSLHARRMSDLYDRATILMYQVPQLDQAVRERRRLRDRLDALTERGYAQARAAQEPIRQRLGELLQIDGRPTAEEARTINAQMCATTQAVIDSVDPVLDAYHRALQREWNLRSSYMHGMLAHIGEPMLRTALVAEAESVRMNMHVDQLSAVLNLASSVDCLEDPVPFGPEPGERGRGPACDEQAARHSLELDLEVMSMEISCDSVSLEVEPAKLLGPLGEASVSVELSASVSGEVTAFVGPKAGTVGVGTVKGGMFVSATTKEFTGFGFKTETKGTTATAGPVKTKHRLDESVINFVPGPSAGEPPGPLPPFRNPGR